MYLAPFNLVYETIKTDNGDKLYLSKHMPILMNRGLKKQINDLAFSSVSFLVPEKK